MVTQEHNPFRLRRYYQITVEGKIDPSWSDWLAGLQIDSRSVEDGLLVTILSGSVCDQAALRGLLTRLWDLNLVLRSVQEIDPGNVLDRDHRSKK